MLTQWTDFPINLTLSAWLSGFFVLRREVMGRNGLPEVKPQECQGVTSLGKTEQTQNRTRSSKSIQL